MSDNEFFDNINNEAKPEGEQIAQDGAYGWQSTMPQKEEKAEESGAGSTGGWTAGDTAQDTGAAQNTGSAQNAEGTEQNAERAEQSTGGAGQTADTAQNAEKTAYNWNQYQNSSAEKNTGSRTESYTYTGAYAEASAKELRKAAKEAKRHEKQQKKEAKRQRGTGRRVLGRVAAAVMTGILFGCATAGAFIGVLHLTGYADQMEKSIEAAKLVEEYSRNQENNIATGTVVNTSSSDSETDVQAVYNKALPSVVAITNTATYNYNYGFFSYEDEVQGSGSGIIIGKNDTELLIVTNYHVIEDANSLTVTFVDDQTVDAYVKGTAEENDLAVVAVMLDDMEASTKSSISIATLGSEDEVKVGQKVVAIGNALGYGQVLTVGYVSAVDREVTIDNKVLTLLQTDAAINPGNSGGALLNMNGEVIGINSAKYSDTDVEGMGFAIPISLVKEIIDDLMTRETMIKVSADEMGYLGVSVVNSSSTNAYGMPTGAYVYSIAENTPAANSDLQEGDIITKLNDTVVDSKEDLTNNLAYYKGGTTVTLTVQRRVQGRYQEMQIEITLGYRKDYVQE